MLRVRQRHIMEAAPTGCIAEGRDITTVVAQSSASGVTTELVIEGRQRALAGDLAAEPRVCGMPLSTPKP